MSLNIVIRVQIVSERGDGRSELTAIVQDIPPLFGHIWFLWHATSWLPRNAARSCIHNTPHGDAIQRIIVAVVCVSQSKTLRRERTWSGNWMYTGGSTVTYGRVSALELTMSS